MASPPSRCSGYRVLAIAPTSFFADYGCHVRIWGHLNALIRRGHAVRLVTYPSGRDRPPVPALRPSILRHWPVQVGSSWKKIALDLALAPLVLSQALAFRPHLVHAFLHEGVALALPLRLLRIPILFDYQGSLTAEMLTHRFLSPRSPLLPLWRRVETALDRKAAILMVSTSHAREYLTRHVGLPPDRVLHLPDSVDPSTFRPANSDDTPTLLALRARWNLDPARPVIAYLGLLAPYQGVDTLLHAFRHLLDRWHTGPRPLLLLMGFPFVHRYRELAHTLGLDADVRLTGLVPYDEAPNYLRLAQVAVAPKRPVSEGAGKLLPYMATALPVVATDTPAHRAYLADDAYYCPPDDPQGLARALHQALTDPTAPAHGARLRARVLEAFTWDHAAARIEAAYRRLDRK